MAEIVQSRLILLVMFMIVSVFVSTTTTTTEAFTIGSQKNLATTTKNRSKFSSKTIPETSLFIFKKDDDEDLSFIESRDMTREEMLALNKQNEDVMNAELIGMTAFSLILSLPMLYLVWVGFFAETSEIAM